MITLKFRYNPAVENAPIDEPQCWAHEQFPAITVKSVSAAWNWVRKYRDEAPELVENEILEVTADEGTDLTRIPAAILFKRNTKGKLEFKDFAKVKASEEKRATKAASKKAIEKAAIQTVNEVLAEETTEDYPDQGEEFINRDLALSMI